MTQPTTTITIDSTFHAARATVKAELGKALPLRTYQRIQRELCGMSDCRCGGVHRATIETADGVQLVAVPTETRMLTGRTTIPNAERRETISLEIKADWDRASWGGSSIPSVCDFEQTRLPASDERAADLTRADPPEPSREGHPGRRGAAQYRAVGVEDETMSTTAKNITDRQIEKLQQEAATAGDAKQVAICERALNGSQRARKLCAAVIAYNEGERS